MTKFISIITAVLLLTATGCSAWPRRNRANAAASDTTAQTTTTTSGRRATTVSPVPPVGGERTFLDTLNTGREVTLSASDLPQIEVAPAPPPAAPVQATPAATPATPAAQTSAPAQRGGAPARPATTAPAAAPAAPAQATTQTAATTARYRIQIMASGSADAARREMASAESALNLPMTIVSEQSLFKVFAGEFATRADAEAALPTVRERYRDAWIVSR